MGGLALWWVWACGTADPFQRCTDMDCRAEVAISAWELDSERVTGWLKGMEDPWARATVANRVVTAHGMGAVSLCTLLETAPQKARCNQVANRPHLRGDG